MHVRQNIAIGFLAALVVILVGAAVFVPEARSEILAVYAPFVGIFGAVTVTYQYPIAGTTAPTAALAAAAGFHNGYNTVRGTVIATLDADTTALLDHNFGLSATAIAAGQPELSPVNMIAAASLSLWTFAFTNANRITATKATTGSSGNASPQLAFVIRRPHSIAV